MRIIEVTGLEKEMAVYTQLTEAQLRNRLSPSDAVFIAESPKVIMTALDAGMTPLSLLCERRHITGDAKCIIDRLPDDFPIYTAERSVLGNMTGYTLTRGVLCAMRRPADRPLCDVLCGARRLAVIDGVTDTTNIGAIFRSAAALGIDGVLLTRTSCDPLNRRSVRVSMGSVFLVPWTWIDSIDQLCDHGFKTVAMALRHDSVTIDDAVLRSEPRLAIVLGTEGDGLSNSVIDGADYVVKIPMAHGVDSLNVAAASAVAFWELTKK
ncbi:MAG: RNA methyltransferase [Muribaculaceae bacterium]|nr:RNA methyltransferase [Muribaculaceae bacterium]